MKAISNSNAIKLKQKLLKLIVAKSSIPKFNLLPFESRVHVENVLRGNKEMKLYSCHE